MRIKTPREEILCTGANLSKLGRVIDGLDNDNFVGLGKSQTLACILDR